MLEYTIRTKAFKRGDKFKADCALQENGQQFPIPEDTQVIAALRTDTSALVANLNIEITDPRKGAFSVSVDDTKGVPVGTDIYLSVVFILGAEMFASATLLIPVIE